jgi:hypothetical protein
MAGGSWMLDKHEFLAETLANGIEYYCNPQLVDFTVIYIQVGRGTAHNTGRHFSFSRTFMLRSVTVIPRSQFV